jgi:uncharacterized membrane protein
MQNIHPLFVHFPIVLALVAALFEILSLIYKRESFYNMASGLVILTAIAAIATTITGFLAESTVPHPDVAHSLMETHETIELIGGSLSVVSALWVIFLKKKARILRTALIAATGVAISYGAFYGGRLVYDYGVGTQLVKSGMIDKGDTHDHMEPDSSATDAEGHEH